MFDYADAYAISLLLAVVAWLGFALVCPPKFLRSEEPAALAPPSNNVVMAAQGSLVDLGLLQLLERSQGGVHKRISEVREVTEVIRLRHPELFNDEFGLTHWLSATDDFLCELRDAAWPEGTSPSHDELRRRFERHQPRPDYDALR